MIDQFSAEVDASYTRGRIKQAARERNARHHARQQSTTTGAHSTRPEARPRRLSAVLASITKTLRLAL